MRYYDFKTTDSDTNQLVAYNQQGELEILMEIKDDSFYNSKIFRKLADFLNAHKICKALHDYEEKIIKQDTNSDNRLTFIEEINNSFREFDCHLDEHIEFFKWYEEYPLKKDLERNKAIKEQMTLLKKIKQASNLKK